MVEIAAVNVMYQSSLDQFVAIFNAAIDAAERTPIAATRAANIVSTMSSMVIVNVMRGLFERDKTVFRLLVALRVLAGLGIIKLSDLSLVLFPAAAVPPDGLRARPVSWVSDAAWMNCLGAAAGNSYFSELPDQLARAEGAWRPLVDDAAPERLPLPADMDDPTAPPAWRAFVRFMLVRCLREDRTVQARRRARRRALRR